MAEPGMDVDAIVQYIARTYPDTDIVRAMNATFFSCDPEKHWPNFATIVTTDEHDVAPNVDRPSKLERPGVYRLNIGVSRATFDATVGAMSNPDFAALDKLMPHPVYAAQHWVCILSPSQANFDTVVKPLLEEAHERAVRGRKKVAAKRRS
jgi:uncharacterized protein DUF6194